MIGLRGVEPYPLQAVISTAMIRSLLSQRWPEWVVWVAAGLILLGGVALSVLARELIQWWGVLVLAGIAALFWWQRRPLTRASDGDSEQAHQRRIAWLVLGASLAFQVVRWIGEEGALRSKAGDDDEAYVFLAYQLLGLFGGPPVFALRPPGWPGIVAGLLALFGREAVWSVGLFHRMLLVATNGLETRYLFYLHPTYLIFTWLSLSLLLDRLRGRANRLEG
jgi:hypothetical protein